MCDRIFIYEKFTKNLHIKSTKALDKFCTYVIIVKVGDFTKAFDFTGNLYSCHKEAVEMNGEKNLKVALLLDYYGVLLTEKQRDVIDLYYNEDLSLGEIAEQENITRQGVRDTLKRGEQTLFELENALGMAARSAELLRVADLLETSAGTGSVSADKMLTAAADIRHILE